MPAVPLLDLQAQYRPLRTELLDAIARVCDSQQFILGPEVDALERELGAGTRGRARGGGVVRHRRDSGRADGARRRSRARGDHHHVLVLRDRGVHRAARRHARVRRHRARDRQHRSGRRAPGADAPDEGDPAGAPLRPLRRDGTDPRRRPRRPAFPSSRTPVRRSARAITAVRPVRSARRAASRFFRPRISGASAMAGWLPQTMRQLAREVRLLRNHGAEPKYHHQRIGGNFRLDALQAAVLRVKLPHLPAWTGARRANADRYARLFRDADLAARVELPASRPVRHHVYNQYVVRVPQRDRVRDSLASGHWHRDLLSGAVPRSGVLRVARLRRGGVSTRRARGREQPGASHPRRVAAGAAGGGRRGDGARPSRRTVMRLPIAMVVLMGDLHTTSRARIPRNA
jgi:hypothetical protein